MRFWGRKIKLETILASVSRPRKQPFNPAANSRGTTIKPQCCQIRIGHFTEDGCGCWPLERELRIFVRNVANFHLRLFLKRIDLKDVIEILLCVGGVDAKEKV